MLIEKKNYMLIENFFDNNIIAGYTKKNLLDMSYNSDSFFEDINNLQNELGVKNLKIAYSKQIHSSNIKIIKKQNDLNQLENYDGLITNMKNIMLITFHADCLPIFLIDEQNGTYGLIHSGWKGSYLGIVENAIEIFINVFNSNLDNIKIFLGIGIRKCCYEVQKDFIDRFENKFNKKLLDGCFNKINEKYYFDNVNFIYNELVNYGIKQKNIEKSDICNKCSNKFFSHRHSESERNIAFIIT